MRRLSMKLWRKPLDADDWTPPKGCPHIIDNRCKGCVFCVDLCPKKVLKMSERFNIKGYHPPEVAEPEDCIACKLCELICPEFAIWVEIEDNGSIPNMTKKEGEEDVE
jgi:2-oxoglutarate ferredoxin oxidoreductase subunit delta